MLSTEEIILNNASSNSNKAQLNQFDLDQFNLKQLKEIEEKIINIMSEFIKIDNIDINYQAIVIKNLKDFGLDSLDITEIIMSIESEFDVHFTEQDYDKLSNINSIAQFILNKNNEKN